MKTTFRLSLLLVALTGSLLTSCAPTDDDTIVPVPTQSGNVHIARPDRQNIELAPIIDPALSQTAVAPAQPIARPVIHPVPTPTVY